MISFSWLWRWQVTLILALLTACVLQPKVSRAKPVLSVKDMLDCRWEDKWSGLLDSLIVNRDAGFPPNLTLRDEAADLVAEFFKKGSMVLLETKSGIQPRAWSWLLKSICTPNSELFREDFLLFREACVYGFIAAAWLVIRHRYIPNVNSSNLVHSLIYDDWHWWILRFYGDNLDFSEESSWPVTPLDFYSILVETRFEHRKNGHLLLLRARDKSPIDEHRIFHWLPAQPIWRVVGENYFNSRVNLSPKQNTIVAWEYGIHKTLSAEVLTVLHHVATSRGLRFDSRHLIRHQYPAKMDRCALYESEGMSCNNNHDEISKAAEFNIVWKAMKRITPDYSEVEMAAALDDRDVAATAIRLEAAVSNRARDVDLLIVTQPILLLAILLQTPSLQEKPVVAYLSTLPFYMVDTTYRRSFRKMMIASSKNPKNAFVVQYPWLQSYMYKAAHLKLTSVRGLSLYVGVEPISKATRGLLIVERFNEKLLTCLIEKLSEEIGSPGRPREILYRYDLSRTYKSAYWKEMAKFSAAALYPYTVFVMAFEELYNMAVPIFVPRHLNQHVYQTWYYQNQVALRASLRFVYDPYKLSTFRGLAVMEWFRRPLVESFDSLADLLLRSNRIDDLAAKKQAMREEIASVREEVLCFWDSVLASIVE